MPCSDDIVAMAGGPMAEGRKRQLLDLLWDAQRDSAITNSDNASNFAVRNAAGGSLSGPASIASAILTLGGFHGPTTQARNLLFRRGVLDSLDPDVIVPGFGNSFYRDQIDPNWIALADLIRTVYPCTWGPIQAWSDLLKASGKPHFPNPAAMTAAVAELVGWPEGLEFLLLVMPRILVWGDLYLQSIPSKTLLK